MLKPLVIYHDHCTDGFGAAFAAWLKLGDEAEYLPMSYGQTEHPIYGAEKREIYILDFSLPRMHMEWLFTNAKRVVWLDHHKTAFEMWCGKYTDGDEFHSDTGHEEPTVLPYIILSSRKSGALLAWEYFHPGTEVPMLIKHIDDRDRWQFKLDGSKELHAALSSMKPWTFEQWDNNILSEEYVRGLTEIYDQGAAILRAQEANVASMAKQARKCIVMLPNITPEDTEILGNRIGPVGLAVNACLHQSELGHVLANQSGTFGLIWYVAEDGKVNCSLRSNGDYDVSAIAKAFGGGGHKNASGMNVDIYTLLSWIK